MENQPPVATESEKPPLTPAEAPAVTPVVVIPAKKASGITLNVSNRTILLTLVSLAILGSAYGYRSLLVAATVDGQPISRLAVIRQLEKENGQAALDNLIIERLITTEADKAKVVVAETVIDAEIEKVKGTIAAQGMTLDDALAAQNLTLAEVRKQIKVRKMLEQLLGEAIQVTDADIDTYITDSKLTAPKAMSDEEFRGKIRSQLEGQKFGKEADRWVTEARQKASVHYLVDYGRAPELPVPVQTAP